MSEALPEVMNVSVTAFSGFLEPMRGTDEVVPNITTAEITSPTDGSTVPPVFDISGTGTAGGYVTLWYQFLDPEGPAQSTGMTQQIGDDGTFNYGGGTPSDLGVVEWFVRSVSGDSPRVKVTVEAETPPEPEGK